MHAYHDIDASIGRMLDGDRVTSVFLLLPSPAFALPPEPAANGFLQTSMPDQLYLMIRQMCLMSI